MISVIIFAAYVLMPINDSDLSISVFNVSTAAASVKYLNADVVRFCLERNTNFLFRLKFNVLLKILAAIFDKTAEPVKSDSVQKSP